MKAQTNDQFAMVFFSLLMESMPQLMELQHHEQLLRDDDLEYCNRDDLVDLLSRVKNQELIARGAFDLHGCKVSMRMGRCGEEYNKVIITNVVASNPGTGQFKNFIVDLENLLVNMEYKSLEIEMIGNKSLYKMLLANGYIQSKQLFEIVDEDGIPLSGALVKILNSNLKIN